MQTKGENEEGREKGRERERERNRRRKVGLKAREIVGKTEEEDDNEEW